MTYYNLDLKQQIILKLYYSIKFQSAKNSTTNVKECVVIHNVLMVLLNCSLVS